MRSLIIWMFLLWTQIAGLENECTTLNSMDFDGASAAAYNPSDTQFRINDSTALLLTPVLIFYTTGDLGNSYVDPSCSLTVFNPTYFLNFQGGVDVSAYLSLDQSNGQITFDVPTDDFSTVGAGNYKFYASENYGNNSTFTTTFDLTFTVITSCDLTTMDTPTNPTTMTTAAGSATDVTQQASIATDYESAIYGTSDGLSYCGPRKIFLSSVTDSSFATISQSFLKVDQQTGVFTLNSGSLTEAGTYTAYAYQCLEYFPSICTVEITFSVEITSSHCSVLISLEWDSATLALQGTQTDIEVNVDTAAVPFQGNLICTTEDLSGTQYVDDACCSTDFTFTYSFVRHDGGSLGSWLSFDPMTGAGSSHVVTDQFSAISNFEYDYSASTTVSGVTTTTSVVSMTINVYSYCDIAPTSFHAYPGGTFYDLTCEVLNTDPCSLIFAIARDTESDNNTPNDGLSYCGSRTLEVTIYDSSATLVPSPNWLTISTDTSQHTISVQSSSQADVGTYETIIKTCLDNFGGTICSAQEIIKINIIPCQVTSITEGVASSYVMYLDNGSIVISEPTYTYEPACGYTTGSIMLTVNDPLAENNNGDGTWTLSGITDRSFHGAVIPIVWSLTLSANCEGVCEHSFTSETVTLTDLCETTVISVTEPFPYTMSCVEAGNQVDYTFHRFTDSVADSKGDPNYCGDQAYSVDRADYLTVNGLVLELLSTAACPSTNPFTAQFTAGFVNFSPVLTSPIDISISVQCCVVNLFSAVADQTMNIGEVLVINFPTYTTSNCNTGTFYYSVAYRNLLDSSTGTLDSTTLTVQQATIDLTTGSETFTIRNYDLAYAGKQIQLTVSAWTAQSQWSPNSDNVFKVTFTDACSTSSINDALILDQTTGVLTNLDVDLTTTDTYSDMYSDPNGTTALCGPLSYSAVISNGVMTFSTSSVTANILSINPDSNALLGDWTVTVTSYLTNYNSVTLDRSFTLTVTPCQVLGLVKTGASDNAVYEIYKGMISYNVQGLAQDPPCGYTEQYSIVNTDGSAASPIFGISGFQYTVESADLTDVNTYTQKIAVTYTNYPVQYTCPTFYSDDITITIEDPCQHNTAIENFSTIDPMTTSELLGTPVIQYFTQPTDTLSRLFDPVADYSHFVLVDQTPTYNTAEAGAFLCGPRQYTVSANCATFLTVDASTAGKPLISLQSNSVTEQGTYSCTLEATLANFASVAAKQSSAFDVTITDCVIVTFTKVTTNPTTIIEYTLGGTAQVVTFPTYAQEPDCQYALSYTCTTGNHNTYAAYYPAGDSAANADPQNAATANVASISSDCTVSGATDVTYDIRQYDTSANLSLVPYQYQGDYAVEIMATTVGAPVTFTDSSFIYILRVVSPCIYKTFKTELNYLTVGTAISDYATAVLNPDDASETQTVSMYKNWASQTYGNQDGYTLCGGASYSVTPAEAWFFFTTDTTNKQITGYIDATLSTQINYVGYSNAAQNTCWSLQVDSTLVTFPVVTISDPFLACIEECKPTAIAMGAGATTAMTYVVNDPVATYTVPLWTQTPACGYSFVYTAEIEKSAVATSSAISEPVFDYTSIDNTAVSGVTFDPVSMKLSIQSAERAFSGNYNIKITAVLQETKYNQALNTNAEIFTLTIVDECSLTLLNNVTPTSLNIAFANMVTGLIDPTLVQSYVHTPLDTVGLEKGCTDNSLANSLSCYVEFCGPRTITTTSYTWLTLDQTAFTLSVQSSNPKDINFVPNSSGSAAGHKVDITICLDDYFGVCSATQTIWVQINECTITSLTPLSVQADITHTIFDSVKSTTVITYTQSPACNWSYLILAEDVATGVQPSWLTYDDTLKQWQVVSISASNAGTYTIRQKIQLQDSLQGNFVGTMNSDITFVVTLVNPCKVNNYIIPQNGAGETFDSARNVDTVFLMQSSVLFGLDTNPNGTPVVFKFTKHDDYVSRLYRASSGLDYCCGNRFYSIDVVARSPNDGTRLGKFASIYDVAGSTTLEQISIYTWDDLDIAAWQLKITVQLFDYSFDGDNSNPLNIIPPSVSAIYEYAWVEIAQCIVVSFKQGTMTPSKQATLDSYQDPLKPFTFEVYYYQQTSLTLSTYVLKPNCSYEIQYEFVVNTYPKNIAPNNFLNSFAFNANPIAGFLSSDSGLDQADYGVVDPITNTIDYTQPIALNPYFVTYRAYIQNYNPSSLFYENMERQLYIWPKDPCHLATLTPDTNINGGAMIDYFLGDLSFKPVTIKFTKDSFSLNPTYSPLSQLGNERCGGRSYQIVMEETSDPSSLATISGEPLLDQEIVVYTENQGTVGENTVRVMSCLADYSKVCAYASFIIKVYMIKLPQAIEDQYYQIQTNALMFTVGQFVLVPNNPIYTIKYSLQVLLDDVAQYPTPAWVTFNEQIMLVTVATNDVSVAGNWTVCVRGRPFDGTSEYGIYTKLCYTQVMSLSPPPIKILIPPEFVSELEDQVFRAGESLYYQLPETFSRDGYEVKIRCLSSYDWLYFDQATNSLVVAVGSTDQNDVGTYVVQIELTDEKGATKIYTIGITIAENSGLLVELEDEMSRRSLLPVPKIFDLSARGVITINWNKSMKIPRNLTIIEQSNTTWFFEELGEVREVPALDIQVHSGGDTPQNDLIFVWKFISFASTQIKIQLIFDDPYKVSYNPKKDYVQITFYQSSFFTDTNGAPVLGGPDGSVLKEELPPQIPHVDIVADEEVISAGAVFGDVGQAIFQLIISYFLNNLWSMISTQQIIVMIPLFEVSLPVVTGQFFKFLMEVAAFDIIPTDLIFSFVFDADPPDPISENFGQVGFETTYFFFNLGSLTIALFSFPFQVVISFILKKISSNRSLMRVGLKMERNLYWNNQIVIFSSSYVILIVCAMIQMTAFEWDNGYGPFIFSFFAIFYGVACIIFPFFQLFMTWYNFKRLGDRSFQKRFGSMWEGMDTSHKGFLSFNFWFIARRFQMALLVVSLRGMLFFQIAGLVFQTLVAMIVAGEGHPFLNKRANKMEFFNEIMILMILYNVMCLTDFQPNLEVQDQQGYIMIFCVLFHIFVNLTLMLVDQVGTWQLKWARYRMLRKYAKMKAEQSRTNQKKLRHERWKKLMQEIKEEKRRKGESVNNEKKADYAMAQVQKSHGSDQIQLSEDLFDDNANINNANLGNLPAEAPDASNTGVINEFADTANLTNQALNIKLGSRKRLDSSQNFVRDVHKGIARSVPLDILMDDPTTVLQSDMPEEWNEHHMHKHARLEQSPYLVGNDSKLNANQQINNRIGRNAVQDNNISLHRFNKVKPITRKDKVLRIVADAGAIHSKLFMKHEGGDESHPTPRLKRKPIIPTPMQNFVVPRPRELTENNVSLEDDADKQATQSIKAVSVDQTFPSLVQDQSKAVKIIDEFSDFENNYDLGKF